jgi:hypothetical protein
MSVQGSLARGQDVDAVERPGAPRARSTAGNGSVSRSSRRGATLIVGALLAVTLAGCSTPDVADPSPAVVRPVPSPSPTPTPTPQVPVKPERPADMERTDEVGAAAAAVYFLELYPYVKGTGDLSEWQAISFPEGCEFCVNLSQSASDIKAAEQSFVGGSVEAEVAKVYALDSLYGAFPLDVTVRQADLKILAKDGSTVSAEPATSVVLRVVVGHDGASWRLMDVGEVSNA